MKKIFIISIVLVILIVPSTMIAVGKPSDLPEQTHRNGPKENIQAFLYELFQQIALKQYQKKGWLPQGINEVLNGLGR